MKGIILFAILCIAGSMSKAPILVCDTQITARGFYKGKRTYDKTSSSYAYISGLGLSKFNHNGRTIIVDSFVVWSNYQLQRLEKK